jgi:hypothetical protein
VLPATGTAVTVKLAGFAATVDVPTLDATTVGACTL